MNISQDILINQIANKEDVDVATVRQIFISAEDIIFNYLSSTSPSEEINIRIFNGFNIKRKYIKKKNYSKGMFQNIICPEHINIKVCSSKYYNGQVNNKLFNK